MKKIFKKVLVYLSIIAIVVQSLSPLAYLSLTSKAYAQTATSDATIVTPTPTPTDTLTPTPTDTVTPTPTDTPIPTDTVTPTVTPTPTDTVTPTPTPVDNNSPPTTDTSTQVQGESITPTPEPTVSPTPTPDNPKNEQLNLVILDNVSAPSIDLQAVEESGSAVLTTDKPDYAPTDTALITGSSLLPNTTYTLRVWSDDQPPTGVSAQVTSDANGVFAYAYQLDGTYRPNYSAELKDSTGTIVATVTFTDTGAPLNPSVKISQCQNGGIVSTPERCATKPPLSSTNYVPGAVNGTKAHWREGDVLPYRAVLADLAAGDNTVTFSFDTAKSSELKHAIDYLASYDYTETTGSATTTHDNQANPCEDTITGCDPSTPDAVAPIIVPSYFTYSYPTSCANGTFSGTPLLGQEIKAWGDISSTMTLEYPDGAMPTSGDCSPRFKVTFHVNTDHSDVVIAWGGHIAANINPGNGGYWGAGNAIPTGSPYHMHAGYAQESPVGTSFSVGSQDLALASGAVIPNSTITIIKTSVGGDDTFNYSTTGGNDLPATFPITTSSGTGTQSYTTIIPGTYSVSEDALTGGWGFSDLQCNATGTGTSVTTDLANRKANITIGSGGGGNVTCTYTNTKQATLTVNKVCSPTNDNGKFNLQIDSVTKATDASCGGTTGAVVVSTGAHTVGELSGTGTNLSNYTSVISGDCSSNGSVSVASGENKVCTITNTRDTGSIELKKIWSGTGGQTTLNIGTSANGSQIDTQLTGAAGATPLTTDANTVSTGTYYLSETSLPDYSTSLSCVNGTGAPVTVTNSSVSVAKDDVITCTYTNTRKQGTVELQKVWSGTGGQVTLTIGSTVNGTDVASQTTGVNGTEPLTTGQKTVDTSTYYLNETGLNANYTASALSCFNDANNNGQNDSENPVSVGASNTVAVAEEQHVICVFNNTRNQGDLLVHKEYDSNGDGTYDITSDATANTTGFRWGFDSTTPANNTTNFGSQQTLDTNSYSVYENSISGYHFTGWFNNAGQGNCANPDGATLPASATVSTNTTTSITLCNQRDTGSIELKKHWVGTAGSTTLNIGTSAGGNQVDTQAVSGQDDTTGVNTVGTGTYYVSETGGLTDYNSSLSCTKNNQSVTPGQDNSLSIATGDTVVCTFTNTRNIGSVKVNKLLDNGDDTTSVNPNIFTWTLDDGSVNQMGGTVSPVDTGSHSVAENSVTGYHLVGWYPGGTNSTQYSCSNLPEATAYKSLPASINVSNDQTTEITICNAIDKGTLKVNKITNPSSDTTTEFEITASGTGTVLTPIATQSITGGSSVSYSVTPGTYDVAEDALSGWSENISDCQDKEVVAGGTTECTIYNTKLGHIIVDKVTNPSGDSQSFDFVLANSQQDGFDLNHHFSLTDQATPYDSGPISLTGTYSVLETVPTGWDQTNAVCTVDGLDGTIGTWNQENHAVTGITLGAGQTIHCSFTNTKKGTVIVTKYLDKNANGTKDEGENVLSGWTINLGEDSKVTGADENPEGQTQFSVAPDEYVLSENMPNDTWIQSGIVCDNDQSTYKSDTLNLNISAGDIIHCSIGNYQKAHIIVTKDVVDPNGNPVSDNSVNFDFRIKQGEEILNSFSLSDGQTSNTYDVNPGTYDVNEVLNQDNYTFDGCTAEYEEQSAGINLEDGKRITLDSNDTVTVTCVNKQKTGTITGEKWNDLNKDSYRCGEPNIQDLRISFVDEIQDSCEPTLSNWTIELFQFGEGWEKIDETKTGSDGSYSFDVAPGRYKVCEVIPAGWNQTYPVNQTEDECHFVTVSSGETTSGNDFGNYNKTPILTIAKTNDAVGNKAPGDVVTYTLTVSADETGGPSDNVKVTDLLPEGFKYNAGSWQAFYNGVLNGNGVISEPTYHSPGIWTLGHMNPGDIYRLVYTATVNTSQQPGTYYDNAWAQGTAVEDSTILLASAVGQPGQLDDNFVGTEVKIVINNQSGSYSTTVTKEVLGASTYLPATGENTLWVIIATILSGLGLGSLLLGLKLKRRYVK